MDRIFDRTSTIAQKEKEDRISKLPDNIIHHILSFMDMKYAVQTSKLSPRWERIWTSMPCLNLNSDTYGSLRPFAKFVKRALSHRNNGTHVSTVTLTFIGNNTPASVKSIVNYAYSHNVRQLMIEWTAWKRRELPQHFFSCHTLNHLTLRFDPIGPPRGFQGHVPNTAWDFPALETLNLSCLRFGEDLEKDMSLDLFSKCVNLKDLTLHLCSVSCVLNFNICAPQLLNLTITDCECFPKVFNVVAPQLKNFTASVMPPCGFLPMSTEGLDILDKVNLSLSWFMEDNKSFLPRLLDLFQKLHSAKFLILDGWIIEALSLCMDEVSHQPCPFNNLKCLKIDMAPLSQTSDVGRIERMAKKVPQVKKYLLENSPNAIFIMDSPQVPPMRKRVKKRMQPVQNNTMAKKMTKLDVPTTPKPSSSDVAHHISRQEVHIDATTKKMEILEAVMQLPETIPEEKSMLEAKLKKQDEVIAKQKEMFEAKIQMQDEVNEKQQAMFDLKMRMQDEVIAKQKTMFVAQIQMQDKVIAEQKAMFEARIEIQDDVIVEQKEKLQIQEKVIAKQKAMFEVKTKMVEAAKLQHEKLISLIIKSKIAELKVKLERGNPDHEVVRSTGIDIKSVMDLIPESLRVNLEARFSSMYDGFKSLFLTHVDDSQWEKIESELKKEYMGFLEYSFE